MCHITRARPSGPLCFRGNSHATHGPQADTVKAVADSVKMVAKKGKPTADKPDKVTDKSSSAATKGGTAKASAGKVDEGKARAEVPAFADSDEGDVTKKVTRVTRAPSWAGVSRQNSGAGAVPEMSLKSFDESMQQLFTGEQNKSIMHLSPLAYHQFGFGLPPPQPLLLALCPLQLSSSSLAWF